MMYKYEISKEFHFSASHQLHHLPEGHQCARLHGHNYEIKIVLGKNELNDDGFVRDYGELKPLKEYIDNELDHRHLNDVMPMKTTAENIAKFIYNKCRYELGINETIEVAVSETPKTWARYREVVKLNNSNIKRFKEKYIEIKNGCWEWQAGGNEYGVFWLNGKNESAHRISYIINKGAIKN